MKFQTNQISTIERSKIKESTCKNCGHPVVRFLLRWYHIDCINQLTIKCWETSDCGCPYPEPDGTKIKHE